MATLYDILGIEVNATCKDIRKAYLRKVVSEHPDKGGTASSFERIHHAYKTLSNPGERTIYDEKVLGQRVAEENESRYPPMYYSADGVTVEFHGQEHSSKREFHRKGESRAGQGEDEVLVDLNRDIEERHTHHLEHPAESARDLAMAYIARAVYHLNQKKASHALFDVYEAQHVYPNILDDGGGEEGDMDHSVTQQVRAFLDSVLKRADDDDDDDDFSFSPLKDQQSDPPVDICDDDDDDDQ